MRPRLRGWSSVVLMALCLVVLANGPVSAGGSNWTFDREHYEPGDTVFAWAAIAWEHNPGLGTPAEGPYHASLVEYSAESATGRPLDGTATPVGDLNVSLEPYGTAPLRFGPHHVELTFTVPNVPPGRYVVVHANDVGKTVGDLSGQSLLWIDPASVRATPTLTG